jgi:hypothetical protein
MVIYISWPLIQTEDQMYYWKLKYHGTVNRHAAFFAKERYLVEQQLIWARTVPQSIRIPPESVHDLIKRRILRNLCLPEIIKFPKRNSASVAAVSSVLITPNSVSTTVTT